MRVRILAAVLAAAHLAACSHLGPSKARVTDLVAVEFQRVRVMENESGATLRVAGVVGTIENSRPSESTVRIHYALGVAGDSLPGMRGVRIPLLPEDLANVEVLRTPARDDGGSHGTILLIGAGVALVAAAYYLIFVLPLTRP